MERLFETFAARRSGVVNIRLTANEHATELLGLPWELLLHDSEVADLRDKLSRIAIVRSLRKTADYHPNKMGDRFRVLLLQGAAGKPALNFEAERKALDAAWSAIGKLLNDRIEQPKVVRAKLSDLATHLSTNALLDWLERKQIVTKWERKGLGIGLRTRNELSHVEHSTTDIPSSDKLRFVAGLVNKLFHSLP
jgi:hypothetical protein